MADRVRRQGEHRRSLGGGALAVEEALPDGWGPGGLLAEGHVVRPQDVALVTADLPRGRVVRAWAAGREPRRKLATVATAHGVDCRLYTAWVDGEPAAAIVVLWGGTTAAYWRGAMDERLAGPSYANYLLHRTAIQEAADAGLGAYHMGDSAPDSSLAHFKSRFGARELPYCSYGLERRPLTWALRARRRLRRQGAR